MSSASEQQAPRQPPAPGQWEEPGGWEREPLPQFDWLTEVAIPICVFGLLGSLLYYLIEVRATLAGPQVVGPLRWVVFWFLLACIGIARIRTKYGGAAIAGYYSALLAGAMALFVYVYTGRSGAFYGGADQGRWLALLFNWALVGMVWWAASAVTREATLEENVETQLEGGLWTLLAEEWRYPDSQDRQPDEQVDHARVRPQHPGRLVLWVSLAALVLFAIGQKTIGGEGEHARVAFWCMGAYVLFALLVLALTNLSALRMQVRRRGISLAPAVTPAWIIASALVVFLIVIFSASMPRLRTPGAEPQFVQVPPWLTDNRRPGMEQGPAQGLGPEGSAPGEGEDRGLGREEGGERPGPGDDQGRDGGGEEGEEPREGGASTAIGQGAEGGGEGRGRGRGSGQGQSRERGSSARQQPAPRPTVGQPHLGVTGRILLWLLLLAAALAALYFLWAHRAGIWRALRRLPGYVALALSRMWQRLAQLLSSLSLPRRGAPAQGNLPEDPFVDIFERGLDADLAPAQVIRYVYRAFQAYTARSGYERREEQTALEFLRGLPSRLQLPDRGAERLTRAYVLATYSPRQVTDAQVNGAREIWRMMKQRIDETGREST
ncbi:MAG: DUF4129 domain-containing protein [Armatimonadota bacterium]